MACVVLQGGCSNGVCCKCYRVDEVMACVVSVTGWMK